ncbi:major capsid protein [Capybara microvirus Cap1_SP_45]|nr:major capsid protein [Capybara microvirus Cap1_SP_45]
MSNNNSQTINISKASKYSRISLDEAHLTTLDFGQIMPIYSRAIIPGDDLSIDTNVFTRTSPLVYPSFVNAHLTLVSVFVPYYQLSPFMEPFFAGVPNIGSKVVKLPLLTNHIIDHLFTDLAQTLNIGKIGQIGVNPDIIWTTTDNLKYGTQLNYKGRLMLKVLNSLGYQVSKNVSWKSSVDNEYKNSPVTLNPLPFISYIKVYKDWFSSNKSFNTSYVASILNRIQTESDFEFTPQIINSLFDYLRLLYDTDYFTTAWQYNNYPSDSSKTSTDILPDPSWSGLYDGNRFLINPNENLADQSDPEFLGATTVRLLSVLDKYIRRNSYAGTKAAARVLSRFGIKSTEFKSQYSDILNVDSIRLNIGDVTSTAETTEMPLGSYAGKAILGGKGGAKLKSNDFGHFFVIAYISAKTCYPSGFDRECLKSHLYDFYTPEFDGVGLQPISMQELSSENLNFTYSEPWHGNDVFGFTERYNEYRFGKDRITGDMLRDMDFKPWYLSREDLTIRDQDVTAQSDPLLYYPINNESSYTRIFANTSSTLYDHRDHFFMSCYFNVSGTRPILNLSDSLSLGHGDINLNKEGLVLS